MLQGVGFAVVIGQLTRLSDINREQGFAAGDEALREVAECFERVSSKRPGTLAARLSGSRVAVLATGVSADEAEAWVAAELPAELDVTLSAVAWQHGDDGFSVIGRAKAAGTPIR